MFCTTCGRQISDGSRFCSNCGAAQVAGQVATQAAAPTPAATQVPAARIPRSERHRRTLGILWIVDGLYTLLARMLLFSILFNSFHLWSNMGSLPMGLHGFGAFLPLLAQFALVRGVLALISGVGLLMNAGWARVLAILTTVLTLIRIPLGTMLGIYTLWALVPEEPVQN